MALDEEDYGMVKGNIFGLVCVGDETHITLSIKSKYKGLFELGKCNIESNNGGN